MEQILSSCLLCMACQSVCPSGVNAQQVIMEGRHKSVSEKGLPIFKRWAFHRLLKDRKALGKALRMASVFQRLSSKSQTGHLRHLPTILAGMAGNRALPPISSNPQGDRIPHRTPAWPGVKLKGRVGFFSGCYLEFVDTTIGEAGIRVLASQGFEVLYPKGQVCCGAPVLYSGDLEGAKELARINAKTFVEAEVDAVITLCATCGSALQDGYKTIAANLGGEDQNTVTALSTKVMDLTRFLMNQGPLHGMSQEVPLTVTYHDPCHHVRGQGIQEEPRGLLQWIPGIRLVEMSEPARCCGGGGSFSLTHPETSVDIGRWKVKDALESGAQAVVTSCPGCILQIQEVAMREKAQLEVLHLVEILTRALP
jgi:glycolate oxidase iron-sulfur subunit